MAKLSAHGIEIARVVVARDATDDQPLGYDGRLAREEMHYSYRSDGHILRRWVVVYLDDGKVLAGKRSDYGWKLYKRFRPETRKDPARLREVAKNRIASLVERAEGTAYQVSVTTQGL